MLTGWAEKKKVGRGHWAEITKVGRSHWAEITVGRGHMYPYKEPLHSFDKSRA